MQSGPAICAAAQSGSSTTNHSDREQRQSVVPVVAPLRPPPAVLPNGGLFKGSATSVQVHLAEIYVRSPASAQSGLGERSHTGSAPAFKRTPYRLNYRSLTDF